MNDLTYTLSEQINSVFLDFFALPLYKNCVIKLCDIFSCQEFVLHTIDAWKIHDLWSIYLLIPFTYLSPFHCDFCAYVKLKAKPTKQLVPFSSLRHAPTYQPILSNNIQWPLSHAQQKTKNRKRSAPQNSQTQEKATRRSPSSL